MKIVATIEARMESSRLPGKTLAPVLGRPMLELLIERVRRLHPDVKVIVFSACERPALVLAALHAGASGYVVKRQSVREVADGIIAVKDGGTVLAPQVASAVLDPRAGTDSPYAIARLT